MHQATEALERQLQVRRTLRKSIESVNDRGASAFFAQVDSLRDDAYQWANDFTMLGLAQPMYWTSETSEAVARSIYVAIFTGGGSIPMPINFIR